MKGFGVQVLAYDASLNPECEILGARYVSKEELYAKSDMNSLHLPSENCVLLELALKK